MDTRIEPAKSIDLNLEARLRDRDYRQRFFLAEASAKIAAQLIALRKRRGKNQSELAKIIGTGQSAISRVEQADYQNWSFKTLRLIADALDARIRVIIEPSEDILGEYISRKTKANPNLPKQGSAYEAAKQEIQNFQLINVDQSQAPKSGILTAAESIFNSNYIKSPPINQYEQGVKQ